LSTWHSKGMLRSVIFGAPLAFLLRWAARNVPLDLRKFPRQLPHLVLYAMKECILYLSENFSIEFLVAVWLSAVAIVYLLPKGARPGADERRLAKELARLEKEVKDLAESLHEIDEDARNRTMGSSSDEVGRMGTSGARMMKDKKKK
jgi:cell division protein FtsB